MRTQHLLLLACSTVLVMASCKKTTDPRVHPAMAFRTDSGYVAANDTVGQLDSLVIGVIIDKTEDPLTSLNITRTYDSQPSQSLQNISLSGQTHVVYDHHFVTRAQAGLERYTFSVLDRDGNITTKSIDLVVQ
ncbi:MAG TPA: hypothetical protein PK760_09370 [Flavobacteriales bacterium]|nr:hypothetical protein [Flavobacteriales bacterium]